MLMDSIPDRKYQNIDENLSPFHSDPCRHIHKQFVLIFHDQTLGSSSHSDKPEAIKYLQYNSIFIALLYTFAVELGLRVRAGSFPSTVIMGIKLISSLRLDLFSLLFAHTLFTSFNSRPCFCAEIIRARGLALHWL